MSPIACVIPIVPFCLGLSPNFFDNSGRMVPNMAAIMP